MEQTIIATIILFLGAAQGFFLGGVLIQPKKIFKRSLLEEPLALLVLVVAFLLIFEILLIYNIQSALKVISPFVFPMFLLIGPFIYFFALKTVNNDIQRNKKIVHLFPYFFFVLFFVFRIYFGSNGDQNRFDELLKGNLPFGVKIFILSDFFSRLIYTTLAAIQILQAKRKKKIKNTLDLRLLKILLFFSFLSLVIYLSVFVFSLGWKVRLFTGLIFSLMMYVVGYFYIREKILTKNSSKNESKYAYSPLSDDKKRELYFKLLNLMKTEKPYLNPDLTAIQLAEKLEISQNYLSQLLNEVVGKNFYEFINNYRIEEAKKILSDKENTRTILSIAYDVGFNSKTTFNTAFKKIVNMSPTEYRKSILSQ